MTSGPVEQKIARLRTGGIPRVLDLFSGCGGLSLGFQTSGFEIVAGIENEPNAARSHGLNFHGGVDLHSKARDVSSPPEELAADLDLGPISQAVDVIVGGPPCQAFSRVGRPKLREIEDHPDAFIHDPRARLYLEWLHYVDAFEPLAVLMENVPDVLSHGGQNVAEETCEVLEEKGYICGYTLLNAAFYGVPQMRERMFLIGYRREVANRVVFPEPTHWVNLPPGYEGSRSVALKLLRRSDEIGTPHSYIAPPEAGIGLKPAVSAFEAIGDLPPIDARAQLRTGELKKGARRFDIPLPWDQGQEISEYGRLMRAWPSFEAKDVILDHVIRYLPRDYELFARMNAGDQYPQAWQHANNALDERIAKLSESGQAVEVGSSEYELLRKQIVPPYDVNKFPNKWRKMWRDEPARTLMAHLGKDSYSHIHYDSRQARPISVREAARLQSFPDGFVFSGTMNPAFRQVGNAVPPLMAKSLASEMLNSLGLANNWATDGFSRAAATI
jgi:DNA (cytosine-5)-methyltransferase 1